MRKYFYSLMTDRIHTPVAKAIQGVLWLFSILYGVVVRALVLIYKFRLAPSCRLGKPVISIGNITLGGVGKTPLVECVVRFLKDKGLEPVVLIRGYGADKQVGSDEAKLLEESLPGIPVLVGANRVKNARDFLTRNAADVFVLDDGFQHWRLRRDLDIVAINATNPFGNRHLLPRGILREPLSALRRADIFVLTKTEIDSYLVELAKSKLKILHPAALIVKTVHQPLHFTALTNSKTIFDLLSLKGKTVCALCSIGDPDSFVKMLSGLDLEVRHSFSFLDHHVYTQKDIQGVMDFCRAQQVGTLVTTEKDAVKLRQFAGSFDNSISVFVLKIQIDIVDGKEDFLKRLLKAGRV